MGSKSSDEDLRSGAIICYKTLIQVGMVMIPLAAWPLEQWAMGLRTPAENLKIFNQGE
jgi:hypothetical protein